MRYFAATMFLLTMGPMQTSANAETIPSTPAMTAETSIFPSATRLPKRDTKSPLYCTAADAAPKLADRSSEGSCRSHTKAHEEPHQAVETPIIQALKSEAITGR